VTADGVQAASTWLRFCDDSAVEMANTLLLLCLNIYRDVPERNSRGFSFGSGLSVLGPDSLLPHGTWCLQVDFAVATAAVGIHAVIHTSTLLVLCGLKCVWTSVDSFADVSIFASISYPVD
jgi:hypothetical protein